ncbi:MAG: 1,4-beta-xylanase [Pirellulaceae bacterium]|nr:1,4-beta-xylanase [Pirellulaceae bacterium]
MFAIVLSGVHPLIAQKSDREQPASTQASPADDAEDKSAAKKEKADTDTDTKKKKAVAPFQWVNELPKNHHPLIRHATFRSTSLGIDVGYCILLPREYEQSESVRFPVVYYLHGGRPGSEIKAIKLADQIVEVMDSAAVAPAIYVFPNGGPVSHYNMPDDPKRQGADVFIRELIPHIDATYRTIASRSGRALEGFSQGGRGTMRLALRYPELFCSAAAGGGGFEAEKRISTEGGYENPNLQFSVGDNAYDLARAYTQQKKHRLRWMIYVGSKGINYKNNLEYMRYLDFLKIPYERVVIPDATHSAIECYDQAAKTIMRFHAANFVRAATLDAVDTPRNLQIEIR